MHRDSNLRAMWSCADAVIHSTRAAASIFLKIRQRNYQKAPKRPNAVRLLKTTIRDIFGENVLAMKKTIYTLHLIYSNR